MTAHTTRSPGPCGCKYWKSGGTTYGGKVSREATFPIVEMCPKHKAADAMLEALVKLRSCLPNCVDRMDDSTKPGTCRGCANLHDAIVAIRQAADIPPEGREEGS